MREVVALNLSTTVKFGLWLSLVERLVRDQEAVGSNPTSPTAKKFGSHESESNSPAISEIAHEYIYSHSTRGDSAQVQVRHPKTELKSGAVRGWIDNRRTKSNMGSLKKRRKAKISKHKRRKRMRANRHKKRLRYKS